MLFGCKGSLTAFAIASGVLSGDIYSIHSAYNDIISNSSVYDAGVFESDSLQGSFENGRSDTGRSDNRSLSSFDLRKVAYRREDVDKVYSAINDYQSSIYKNSNLNNVLNTDYYHSTSNISSDPRSISPSSLSTPFSIRKESLSFSDCYRRGSLDSLNSAIDSSCYGLVSSAHSPIASSSFGTNVNYPIRSCNSDSIPKAPFEITSFSDPDYIRRLSNPSFKFSNFSQNLHNLDLSFPTTSAPSTFDNGSVNAKLGLGTSLSDPEQGFMADSYESKNKSGLGTKSHESKYSSKQRSISLLKEGFDYLQYEYEKDNTFLNPIDTYSNLFSDSSISESGKFEKISNEPVQSLWSYPSASMYESLNYSKVALEKQVITGMHKYDTIYGPSIRVHKLNSRVSFDKCSNSCFDKSDNVTNMDDKLVDVRNIWNRNIPRQFDVRRDSVFSSNKHSLNISLPSTSHRRFSTDTTRSSYKPNKFQDENQSYKTSNDKTTRRNSDFGTISTHSSSLPNHKQTNSSPVGIKELRRIYDGTELRSTFMIR
jgi:hypothetical protein